MPEYDPDKYRFYVDWFKTGLYNVSDFEDGTTQGWQVSGSISPDLLIENGVAYSGDYSLRITWYQFSPFTFGDADLGLDTGRFGPAEFSNSAETFVFGSAPLGLDSGRFGYADPMDTTVYAEKVYKTVSGLTVGVSYTLDALVVTETGDQPVKLVVKDHGESDTSALLDDQAQVLSVPFVAVTDTVQIEVHPVGTLTDSGTSSRVDRFRILRASDDVTEYVRDSGITIERGRDASRNLDDIKAGQVGFNLLNTDYRFTPNNTGSNLHGKIEPGRSVRIEMNHNGLYYVPFQGTIDGLDLNPGMSERTLSLSNTDLLGSLASNTISTDFYSVKRTGEAMHVILDAVGWPAGRRDIDSGATIMRYWGVTKANALEAVKELMKAEGLPCIVYVDDSGRFVFRDRHHRLVRDRSVTSQETFSSGFNNAQEPRISDSNFGYDHGFEDVYNSISVTVTERTPGEFGDVWTSEETYTLANNETRTVTVELSTPAAGMITPVLNTDYTATTSGGVATIKLNRTSGGIVEMTMTATGGAVSILDLRIRGYSLVETTYEVKVEDKGSIDEYGLKSYPDTSMPYAGRHDALAVAEIILGHRAYRTPTLTFEIINNGPERTAAIFDAKISDRIHIAEVESFVDHDFYVERLSHSLTQKGKVHKLTFACEQATDQYENVFTFDDADRGFDNGLFGLTGKVRPGDLFILDQTDLDEGLLGF